MALFDEYKEDFVVLNKLVVDSSVPGVPSTMYQEGATFKAIAAVKVSTQMDIAQQQGAKRVYALYFPPVLDVIEQGVMIRRKRDGLTFRVNATPDTRQTPSFSSIPLKYTTMEVITLDR